jgi:hypothetical protein
MVVTVTSVGLAWFIIGNAFVKLTALIKKRFSTSCAGLSVWQSVCRCKQKNFSAPISLRNSMFGPSSVPIVYASFKQNFMCPVHGTSSPDLQIGIENPPPD